MRIFFDTEFTGLHQDTTLISLGMVTETGETFYAESNEFAQDQIDEWLEKNVLAHLFGSADAMSRAEPQIDFAFRASNAMIAHGIRQWTAKWSRCEMWSDCLAYDWVLFCELFGGARYLPKNIYYIPFDLATMLLLRRIDPDINREQFLGIAGCQKHNALWDAKVIRDCVLMSERAAEIIT